MGHQAGIAGTEGAVVIAGSNSLVYGPVNGGGKGGGGGHIGELGSGGSLARFLSIGGGLLVFHLIHIFLGIVGFGGVIVEFQLRGNLVALGGEPDRAVQTHGALRQNSGALGNLSGHIQLAVQVEEVHGAAVVGVGDEILALHLLVGAVVDHLAVDVGSHAGVTGLGGHLIVPARGEVYAILVRFQHGADFLGLVSSALALLEILNQLDGTGGSFHLLLGGGVQRIGVRVAGVGGYGVLVLELHRHLQTIGLGHGNDRPLLQINLELSDFFGVVGSALGGGDHLAVQLVDADFNLGEAVQLQILGLDLVVLTAVGNGQTDVLHIVFPGGDVIAALHVYIGGGALAVVQAVGLEVVLDFHFLGRVDGAGGCGGQDGADHNQREKQGEKFFH